MLNVLCGQLFVGTAPNAWLDCLNTFLHNMFTKILNPAQISQKTVWCGEHLLLSFHKPRLAYVCAQAPSITSHQLLTEKHKSKGVKKKKNLHSSKMMQNAFIRATLVKIWSEPHLLAIQALRANSEDEGQTLAQQTFSWGFTRCTNQ